ncbi:hypothetical protein [Deinococcus sp. PESE-13]
MKRLVVLTLLLPLLASCGSAVSESPVTSQQMPRTLAGEWTANVREAAPALRLTLAQDGEQLRGQAVFPELAWNQAGTFEVRGQQVGQRADAQLLSGGQKVYDLMCQRSANIWTCALETATGGERLSVARAWHLTLTPAR